MLNQSKLTQRGIARQCGIHHKSVQRIRVKLQNANLNILTITDNDLLKIFTQKTAPAHVLSEINWNNIHQELPKRDMTLQLMWEEYRVDNPDGISYSTFCKQYKKWRKTLKVSMRQIHHAGEFIFVDFCGRTMPIQNKDTGEIRFVQVFVGVLGASGYIFAIAVESQNIAGFVDAHVKMFSHLDGVTQFVMSDNLKSAVIKNTKNELELNRIYMELAEHYGFIIMPARPRKPKDKSLGEIGVQIVQRWILARLRHRVFFSIEELNAQILYWVNELNQRTTRTYPLSRVARLESIERCALQSLPDEHYRYNSWAYNQRVDESYHVRFKDKFYSVPYQYAHRHVDIRATNTQLDVFYQRERIAHHSVTSALSSTNFNHLPEHHRHTQSVTPEALLEWATSIGSSTFQFVEHNLKNKQHFAARVKSLINLKRDVRQNNWLPHLETTCELAVRMKSFSISQLCVILRRCTATGANPPQAYKVIKHKNIRGADYYANNGGLQ